MTLNILFVLVAALILFFVWKGYHRGLVGIVFGIVAWIFAIYFIQTATPQIESYLLSNPKVVETIQTHVEKKLEDKVDQATENAAESDPAVKMKELFEKNEKLQDLQKKTEALFNEKTDQVVTESAVVMTANIIHAIATLASIVIAMIIVSLAWTVVHFINHAPIIGKFSRFLGLLFGLLEGFFTAWILMYVIYLIPASAFARWALPQIAENEFLLFLYDNNILRLFFG